MSRTCRVTQGLLLALTITTIVPPMPAWALRSRAGAEVPDTKTGLEESFAPRDERSAQATRASTLQEIVMAEMREAITQNTPTTVEAFERVRQHVMVQQPALQADAILSFVRQMIRQRQIADPKQIAWLQGIVESGAVWVAAKQPQWITTLSQSVDAAAAAIKSIATGTNGSPQKIAVLVDPDVVHPGTIAEFHVRFTKQIPGYPEIFVESTAAPGSTFPSEFVPVGSTPVYVRLIPPAGRMPDTTGGNTVYVKGLRQELNGDTVKVESLLPAVVMDALAHWQRRDFVFDVSPYLPLHDLSMEKVVEVVYDRFV